MKHLVLGSSGQVGAYISEYLHSNNEEVIEWDLELSSNFDLRDKSITDEYLIPTMKECDFVHFLAFDVGGSTYLAKYQDSFQFVNNNVKLMENTFYALEKTKVPFYFASSQMSNMFHSTYGRLKALGESYTSAIGGTNIRFWNVYGYETNPEKTHVITDFIRMAIHDKRIIMRTNGLEERNFLYGQDAAKLLCSLSKKIIENRTLKPSFIGDVIHLYGAVPILSSSNFISMLRLAETVRDVVDGSIQIYTNAHKVDSVQGVKNDIDFNLVKTLNAQLNLENETSLMNGIKEIYKRELDAIK